MAFPSVVATNNGAQTTNTTSHTLNLPDGSNVVGRRLVVGMQIDGNAVSVTWPTNWTEIAVGAGAAGNGTLHVAYHDVDGSESYPATGATIGVTLSASEAGSHVSFLVSSFDSGTAPEAASVNQSGTGTDINPPSLTPTGGAKDYLWLAFGGTDGNISITGFPAGYGDNVSGAGSTAGGPTGGASLQSNAASEDPGQFTASGSSRRSAITVAIHPVAPTGVTVSPGVGSLVIAGFVPTIGLPKTVAPGVGSVVIAGFAPTITTPVIVSPGVGSLVIAGFAPTITTVTGSVNLTPGVGALVIAGFAPTIGTPRTVIPGVGAVVIAGFAPTITTGPTVRPGVGSVTIQGFAPTIILPKVIAPGVGSVAIAGFAPTITTGPTVRPGVGAVTITGFAPTIGTPVTVRPGVGALVITGFAPTISLVGEQVGWLEFDLFLDVVTGGDFEFRWSQNASRPDSLVIKAGSYFEYARF